MVTMDHPVDGQSACSTVALFPRRVASRLPSLPAHVFSALSLLSLPRQALQLESIPRMHSYSPELLQGRFEIRTVEG